MTENITATEPDNTAVRTALWRALHTEVDAEPHIIEDNIGLKLIAPADEWRTRPASLRHMKYSRLRTMPA